jgi:hypothetical protein
MTQRSIKVRRKGMSYEVKKSDGTTEYWGSRDAYEDYERARAEPNRCSLRAIFGTIIGIVVIAVGVFIGVMFHVHAHAEDVSQDVASHLQQQVDAESTNSAKLAAIVDDYCALPSEARIGSVDYGLPSGYDSFTTKADELWSKYWTSDMSGWSAHTFSDTVAHFDLRGKNGAYCTPGRGDVRVHTGLSP